MLQRQSSALRRLEEVISDAFSNGDPSKPASHALLGSMKLPVLYHNITDFYGLLSKATLEAKSIRKNVKLEQYLKALNDFNSLLAMNHVWKDPWSTFKISIEAQNILIVINSLADYFGLENPSIFLEEDFLETLKVTFNNLLEEIMSSEISVDLKNFLARQIGDILTAIYQYDIDGTKGLEKAAKSTIANLILSESTLAEADRKNPLYQKAISTIFGLTMSITSLGLTIAPDYDSFWRPNSEYFLERCSEFIAAINDGDSIQSAFEKVRAYSREEKQKIISGSKPKLLPPGEE
jgi:hypothetical protein